MQINAPRLTQRRTNKAAMRRWGVTPQTTWRFGVREKNHLKDTGGLCVVSPGALATWLSHYQSHRSIISPARVGRRKATCSSLLSHLCWSLLLYISVSIKQHILNSGLNKQVKKVNFLAGNSCVISQQLRSQHSRYPAL